MDMMVKARGETNGEENILPDVSICRSSGILSRRSRPSIPRICSLGEEPLQLNRIFSLGEDPHISNGMHPTELTSETLPSPTKSASVSERMSPRTGKPQKHVNLGIEPKVECVPIVRKEARTMTTNSKYAAATLNRCATNDESSEGSSGDENGANNADNLIDNFVSTALRGSLIDGPVMESTASMTAMKTGPEDFGFDRELAMRLFKSSSGMLKTMEPQHVALNRVVASLFGHDEASQNSSRTLLGSHSKFFLQGMSIWNGMQTAARAIIGNRVVVLFFMILTFYAIFGPDLVLVCLPKDADNNFKTVNTIVFFLFCIELLLQMIGRTDYVLTLTCLLDVISVLSILSDTWLIEGNIFSGDSARVSRMARSSRMTRLARLVRVVRVTRVLPELMRLCGKQRENLGRRLLERRLWRVFLHLDKDLDDRISYFDLKCFYISISTEARHMLAGSIQQLLRVDIDVLCAGDMQGVPLLAFDEFQRVFLSTSLGKGVLAFHIQAVERTEGVWKLTQKLMDNTSLKICIGLIILIVITFILDIDIQNEGPGMGLMQLHEIVSAEKQRGDNSSSFVCEQIKTYRNKYNVMYVYLVGKTFFDYNVCHPQGIETTVDAAFRRMQDIIADSPLRSRAVVQSCWEDATNCDESSTSSASLVDNDSESFDSNLSSLLTTSITVLLLLFFVYCLNSGITNFSKTLLQPLRALVDDMAAMSTLELVNCDREMPSHDSTLPVPEELKDLQVACGTMRSAIKSWSRYVPPAVVQRLYVSGVEAEIGVAKVFVTILFCDIFEFENACRGLSPEDVLRLLEEVLGRIADVINRFRGTLLEFIGDEVLAVFNAPSSLKNHTHAGVAAALEIHKVISEMPAQKSEDGREIPIRCRCGVNTCSILAGNIGSSQRMKYGLLGDGINLTARLKGINSRYQTRTLTSDKVFADERSRRSVVFRPVDIVAVKGKIEPTTIYEPLTMRSLDEPGILEQAAEKHAKAFGYYKERRFSEAKALFEQVQQTFEKEGQADGASRMLWSRCQRYLDEPPGEGWDGVERLLKK